jgi:hypothetical protein
VGAREVTMRALVAIGVAVAALVAAAPARAAPCVGGVAPREFPICFDPGNRLVLEAGWGGVGGALRLRHRVRTSDPGVSWRLEHTVLEARWDGTTLRGVVYQGRYLRHSRDGHIMLPTSPPKKLWLPFDIGAEADAGALRLVPGDPHVDVGVVRAAVVLEPLRSGSFRARLTVGPLVRWDVLADLDSKTADEHRVVPFTEGAAALHLESRDGLSVLDVRAEGGASWSSTTGWGRAASTELGVERVLVAVNDVPIAAFAQAGWSGGVGGRGAWIAAGVRLAFARHGAP